LPTGQQCKHCLRSTSSQLVDLGPPSWSLTTSTVYPAIRLPSLLHLGARKGSQRFSTPRPLTARQLL